MPLSLFAKLRTRKMVNNVLYAMYVVWVLKKMGGCGGPIAPNMPNVVMVTEVVIPWRVKNDARDSLCSPNKFSILPLIDCYI